LVCGRRLALFRDSGGTARAIDATCPHRGADLALGKVEGDSISCPFHGISFDGCGRCTRVPSQSADDPIPARLRTTAYPVRELGGLVWIWPDSESEPGFEPRVPGFLSLPAPWRGLLSRSRLCTGSYLNSLENALDDSHLAFIHTATIPGAPEQVAKYRITVAADRRSFFGEAEVEALPASDAGKPRPKSGLGAGSIVHDMLERFAFERLVQTVRRVDYDISGLVCYTVDYAGGRRDHTFAFFTPADEERTWMTGGIVRNHSLNRLADRFLNLFMDNLMGEDVGAMNLLVPEARGPGGLSPPFIVPADRACVRFRRMYGEALRAEGKTPPWIMDSAAADAA
ncbi:MAG: Rieske 2Fe-2S domain-containing protein, partial [Gammaproteobacteria bacterium]